MSSWGPWKMSPAVILVKNILWLGWWVQRLSQNHFSNDKAAGSGRDDTASRPRSPIVWQAANWGRELLRNIASEWWGMKTQWTAFASHNCTVFAKSVSGVPQPVLVWIEFPFLVLLLLLFSASLQVNLMLTRSFSGSDSFGFRTWVISSLYLLRKGTNKHMPSFLLDNITVRVTHIL